MKPAARSLDLRQHTLCVVGAELHVPDAAGPRTHILARSLERDGFESCGIVRADGGGDDIEECGAGGADAERALGPDECGAEVEAVAALTWNEGFVDSDEGAEKLDHGVGVECGEGDALRRGIEACHVAVRAEEPGLAVVVDVGLHAFEAFKGVMEDAGGGVQGEILVGHDVRGGPAGGRGPFHGEHMVCGGVSGVYVCVCVCVCMWGVIWGLSSLWVRGC